MWEQTGRPSTSPPLQSHPDIAEKRREHPALEPSIPPAIANAKYEPWMALYDLKRIDDDFKPTHQEIRRCSFSSSATADTVEFVRKIATGDGNLPFPTTMATTEKPKSARPNRWLRRIGVLCSVSALVALIVIPVICVCILTGVFVPVEAKAEHGKLEQVTTKVSETVSPTTIYTQTETTTSYSNLQSSVDPPDVTWLARLTKTGPAERLKAVTSSADADHSQNFGSNPSLQTRVVTAEAPTTMETRGVKSSAP